MRENLSNLLLNSLFLDFASKRYILTAAIFFKSLYLERTRWKAANEANKEKEKSEKGGSSRRRKKIEEEVQIGLLTVYAAKGGRGEGEGFSNRRSFTVLLTLLDLFFFFSTRLKIDVSAAVSKEEEEGRPPLDPLLICPFNAGYLFPLFLFLRESKGFSFVTGQNYFTEYCNVGEQHRLLACLGLYLSLDGSPPMWSRLLSLFHR